MTVERSFEPGDKVLVFVPNEGNSLQSKYVGPLKVLKKVNKVNYIVETPGKRKPSKLIHINMMKAFLEREPENSLADRSRIKAINVTNIVNNAEIKINEPSVYLCINLANRS